MWTNTRITSCSVERIHFMPRCSQFAKELFFSRISVTVLSDVCRVCYEFQCFAFSSRSFCRHLACTQRQSTQLQNTHVNSTIEAMKNNHQCENVRKTPQHTNKHKQEKMKRWNESTEWKKPTKKKITSRASTSVWTALVKTRCRFCYCRCFQTQIYLRRNALTASPPYFPKPVHGPRLENVVTRRRFFCSLSFFGSKFVFIFHDLCIAHALSPRAQFTHLIIIIKKERTFHAVLPGTTSCLY